MLRAAFALLFALLALPAAAQGAAADAERITNFDSDITVAANGVLTVRETITVYAAGTAIVHGIYRDFPPVSTDEYGSALAPNILSVTMDGQDEPNGTLAIAGGFRLMMGDGNRTLEHGPHVFHLTYSQSQRLGSGDGLDLFNWDVAGSGWDLSIDRIGATVHLPPGAKVLTTASYVTGRNVSGSEVVADGPNTLRFTTPGRLEPHQSLTVAVEFSQ